MKCVTDSFHSRIVLTFLGQSVFVICGRELEVGILWRGRGGWGETTPKSLNSFQHHSKSKTSFKYNQFKKVQNIIFQILLIRYRRESGYFISLLGLL